MNKEIEKAAKLILAAAVLILFSTILGVAGYLAMNKSTLNPRSQISSTPVIKEDMSVATDKLEYKQGDTIKITVQNNLNQSIGYWNYQGQITPYINIQKFQDGKWEKIESQNVCACKPNCTTYANGWVELKSNEIINDSWDTKTDCTGKTVSGGKYRVWFSYSLDLTGQGGKFTDVYSKEFNIVGNTENYKSEKVKLYYYNKKYDPKFDCLAQAVIPVEREILITENPIKNTLELLIEGKITDQEKTAGFSTEFPHPGFNLLSINLKDGVLTLKFTEVPGFTTGGSCRIGLLYQEVVKTAKQFPEVKQVIFDPAEIFQP